MRMYIIRHGQTAWNDRHCLQGRSNTELNESGRALAREAAEGMRDIPFDLAFTSPLRRARETAELIVGKRGVPIFLDERIIEISFGAYEGMSRTEAEAHPEPPGEPARPEDPAWSRQKANYEINNFFYHPERYVPAQGGETLEELSGRTADFMRDICAREDLRDKTILVSTHGAAMRALLNSLRVWEKKDFWHTGLVPNCGVTIVECTDGKPVIAAENVVYRPAQEKGGL